MSYFCHFFGKHIMPSLNCGRIRNYGCDTVPFTWINKNNCLSKVLGFHLSLGETASSQTLHVSPKWTWKLALTFLNGKLPKPYSQAASVPTHPAAQAGRSERGQIAATNQEPWVTTRNSICIKYVYYWHAVTAVSSSFTINFTVN